MTVGVSSPRDGLMRADVRSHEGVSPSIHSNDAKPREDMAGEGGIGASEIRLVQDEKGDGGGPSLSQDKSPPRGASSLEGSSVPSPPSPPPLLPLPTPQSQLHLTQLLDSIISRLLSLRVCPPGTSSLLSVQEITQMLSHVKPVLLSQPPLLHLRPPIKICGDIHGQYMDLLRLFEYGGFPPSSSYLFLGDYVDRGKQSLETICLLLAYKARYPETIFLLRGNHEAATINRIYGFYDECKRRYSVRLWKQFNDVFMCLPVAALVGGRLVCMHGGLSPEIMDNGPRVIESVERPVDVPDSGLLCDLLWSDPDPNIMGWGANERGVSYTFGGDVVSHFLARHNLDLVVRAHQVVEDGYEFFAGRSLVTVFSAPSYCGEFDNAGGMLTVSEDLVCSFQILKPSDRSTRFPA